MWIPNFEARDYFAEITQYMPCRKQTKTEKIFMKGLYKIRRGLDITLTLKKIYKLEAGLAAVIRHLDCGD